jgi:hypothetical protein
MDAAIPDVTVTGHEHLIDQLTLPDPDDRHVLAAAIHACADARNHERGFDTRVVDTRDDHAVIESLHRLYTGCGLGPAQDVPEQSGTGHVVAKRTRQHAAVLALVMPHLADPASAQALFHRCRSTPSGS